MMKGKIERNFPNEYATLKNALFNVWHNSHGKESDNFYATMGLSRTRFLFDSFYATKIKIGDGIGITGNIVIPDCTDNHIETAVKAIWNEYVN